MSDREYTPPREPNAKMRARSATVDVDTFDRCVLVMECGSGVVYTSQTGGVMCHHPEIEGALVAVGAEKREWGEVMCETGCYGGENCTKENRARIRETLGEGWGWHPAEAVALDESRHIEEGWWPVTFVLEGKPRRGVIVGPNCD